MAFAFDFGFVMIRHLRLGYSSVLSSVQLFLGIGLKSGLVDVVIHEFSIVIFSFVPMTHVRLVTNTKSAVQLMTYCKPV